MENILVPDQSVASIPCQRALVFAPHPDDEVFGCGGAVMRHIEQGAVVHVIIVSDGAYGISEDQTAAYISQRQQESIAAARILGYGSPAFWRYRDRQIRYDEKLIQEVSAAIRETDADLVYAPSVLEMHPDHRMLAMAVIEAVRRIGKRISIALYEIGVPLHPNLLLDITGLMPRKNAAMECFVSQNEKQRYDLHIASLNRYRTYTLPAHVTAAEAFNLIPAEELANDPLKLYRSEHSRQKALGLPLDSSDLPLVSVIVRSMDRSTLSDALDSIALQTYPNIEVVIVNAKGAGHRAVGAWCGRFPMRMVEKTEPLNRGRAANVGLHAAQGNYLIFLDDDDLFYPEHIAVLVDAIKKQNHSHCAYTGTLVQHYEENILSATDKLNQPFHWQELFAKNFLPIHSVMFSKSLLRSGCKFDEELKVYEDWDFWIQLSQHTSFIYVNKITACYRNFGYSGFGLRADKQFIRRSRGVFFDKWKTIWTGNQINDLLEYKETLQNQTNVRYQQSIARHEHNIEALQRDKEALQRDKEALQRDKEALQRDNKTLQRDKEKLLHDIKIFRDSNSWKITAPYRWIGGKIHYFLLAIKLVTSYMAAHGGGLQGWKSLFSKILEKLQQYGLKGVLPHGIEHPCYHQNANATESYHTKDKTLVRPSFVRHTMMVDIIVCIHNALEDVKKCLDSIIRHTHPPYRLLLVDDGSDTETRDFILHFSITNSTQLIRNEFARGYTLAANQGISASQAPYVILLNSDTIVCSDWLDRMIICAESDSDLGIVGPLSNTASWQSIPNIEQNGDWSDNPLPKEMTIEEMGRLVALYSGQLYPRIPFLNGFCLLIKRALIDEIGYFDEENFARGYGEENDFCLRARQAGWQLAVADDVYIYHAQSRSYSSERRQKLCEVAGQVLAQKHGQAIIDEGVYICRHNRVMIGNRIRAERIFERYELIRKARSLWKDKRIIFILPIRDAGGGANVVISEIHALIRMGIDVWLLNFGYLKSEFERSYPEINIPIIYAQNAESIPELCATFNAIIATHNSSVAWIAPLLNMKTSGQILGYYIQDFEPYFYQEGSAEYQSAIASYTLIPDIVCITKTQWNKQKVLEETGVDCALLGPSVDIDLYRPRMRSDLSWPDRPIRVCAMIRPSSPRRGPILTMQVLRFIEKKYGNKIEIILFGEESNAPDFIALPRDFNWRNLGKQTREEIALLLNEVDIFVDFSSYQAMGLTAMEAMACGVAVILPESGGASSFACHEKNALFADTKNQSLCQFALDRLISDDALRIRLQQQSQIDVAQFFAEKASFKMLDALFSTHNMTARVF